MLNFGEHRRPIGAGRCGPALSEVYIRILRSYRDRTLETPEMKAQELYLRILRCRSQGLGVCDQELFANSKPLGAASEDSEIELLSLHFRRFKRAIPVRAEDADINFGKGWTASTRADGTTMLTKV